MGAGQEGVGHRAAAAAEPTANRLAAAARSAGCRFPPLSSRHPHIVAKNSYVDETLFGSPKQAAGRGPASPAKAPGAGPRSPAHRSPASVGHVGRDGTVVLSRGQLDRMMQARGSTD